MLCSNVLWLMTVNLCSCLCEVKLALNLDQIAMYVTDEHIAEDHAKDILQHLVFECLLEQELSCLVCNRESPRCATFKIPTKAIDYRPSVRKPRRGEWLLTFSSTAWKSTTLNTLESLSRLSNHLWFPDALAQVAAQHNLGECIDRPFKTFVIGGPFVLCLMHRPRDESQLHVEVCISLYTIWWNFS